jgi:hypothetical protein
MNQPLTSASVWDVTTEEVRRSLFRRQVAFIITKNGARQDGGFVRSCLTPAQQEDACWRTVETNIRMEQIRIKYDTRNDFLGGILG